MASAKAPVLGTQRKADLPDAVFGEEFHESLVHDAVRADLASRRRGTASTLTRGEVSMTTAKAWRQKGLGRARVGALSVPHRRGGGAAFGPEAAPLQREDQPQGPPPGAARRALGARRARLDRRDRRLVVRRALDQEGRRGARQVGRRRADARRARRRRGRGRRRAFATSSASPCSRPTPSPSPTSSAPPRWSSPRARSRRSTAARRARPPRRRARTSDGRARGDHRARDLGEELRADGGRQVHLPRPRARPEDPDRARGRGDLRRHRRRRADLARALEAEAPRRCTAARPASWKKAIVQLGPGERIEMFEGARWPSRWRSARQSRPRPGRRFGDLPDPRGAHRRQGAVQAAHRGREVQRRAQLPRARHVAATAAAAPSAATGRSTSSAARTASRRASRRSSTTPTAPATSRCSTTPTARSATSSPRRACRSARPSSPATSADIQPGNALPLSAIPLGTVVHNVEMVPGQGGRLGRAAGTAIQVVAKEGPMVEPSPALDRGAHGARASAARPSARSRTPSTRTSSSARPGARATRAGARRRAASR